jgi:hypothetical protein
LLFRTMRNMSNIKLYISHTPTETRVFKACSTGSIKITEIFIVRHWFNYWYYTYVELDSAPWKAGSTSR